MLDPGRFVVTRNPADRGAFKTPTLREVAHTAPYMHDGSQSTLDDVVEYYDRGGNANLGLDAILRRIGLSLEDKRALVAFLRALSGEVREGW
jgi:cytochrome c peroxidase